MEIKDKYWYSIYALPYAYFIGALHLLVYWQSFGINALEHASFFDAVGASMLPAGHSIFWGLVCYIFIIALHALHRKSPFLNTLFKPTLLFFMILYPIFLFNFTKPIAAWGSMALMGFALSYYLFMSRQTFFKRITDDLTRIILALAFAGIPISSGCSAVANTYKTTDKTQTYWVTDIEGLQLIYVGSLGGKYFFTDHTRSNLTIINADSMSHLTLKKNAGAVNGHPFLNRFK